MKTLLVIVGPTASGKTSLAIELAKHYNTEIISADSRQFYKELTVGTAKPTNKELKQVKHHFINSHTVSQNLSAGEYAEQAELIIASLFKCNNIAIVAGGSGLYISALCDGFDNLPEIPEHVRTNLNNELNEYGLERLQNELNEKDPTYYLKVDANNPQRIIRALEIIRVSGMPYSTFLTGLKKEKPYKILKIGLHPHRELLYHQIDSRVDKMIADGLEEEAKTVYPFKQMNALKTVGYKEFFDFFESKISREEAIRKIKQNTRNYAKRQLTWFNKDKSITWFSHSDFETIVKHIEKHITNDV